MICVVEFPNGTFGVRKSGWGELTKYFAPDYEHWTMPAHVAKYCQFATYADAERVALALTGKYKRVKCFGWWLW